MHPVTGIVFLSLLVVSVYLILTIKGPLEAQTMEIPEPLSRHSDEEKEQEQEQEQEQEEEVKNDDGDDSDHLRTAHDDHESMDNEGELGVAYNEVFHTDHHESIHSYSVVTREDMSSWHNLGEESVARFDQVELGSEPGVVSAQEVANTSVVFVPTNSSLSSTLQPDISSASHDAVYEICHATWERTYFPSHEGN